MTRYSITHTPTGRPNNEDEVTIWSTDTLKNRERVSNMKGAIDMFEVLAISWGTYKKCDEITRILRRKQKMNKFKEYFNAGRSMARMTANTYGISLLACGLFDEPETAYDKGWCFESYRIIENYYLDKLPKSTKRSI